ncbi:MAG TPA: hypothetical protein PLO32_10535 [Chitinophagales bacterium]|nr:hypothetical protein [Chitinophagales bacterium]
MLLAQQFKEFDSPFFSIEEYWMKNIQYTITEEKKRAFELFIHKLNPNTQYIYCF